MCNYKENTRVNGINAFNVFIKKPFVQPDPDEETPSTLWRSGELAGYYHDWYFHESRETLFECNSSNVPHKHCMDILIAEAML